MIRTIASLAAGLGLLLAISPAPGRAQVIRDGTIGPGPGGPVGSTDPGCDYCILETMGVQSGVNLFHSFSQFDVGPGETATFFGNSGIGNVIARVPGGDVSEIDGRIDMSGMGAANLYLLNPAGVLFGNGASLELPGAFHVSTADTLHFGLGAGAPPAFDMLGLHPDDTNLAGIDPTHLGFDGGPTGDVGFASGGIIDPADGAWITAVAGNVTVDSGTRLRSRGGVVALAAVGEAATLVPSDLAAWDVLSEASELGTIRVQGGSWIDGRRELSGLASNGRVVLRGGDLVVSGGSFVRAGGDGAAAAIDIEAKHSIDVDSSWILDDGGDIRASVGIHMKAAAIDIHDRAHVVATTWQTLAGDIELIADSISVGTQSEVVAQTTHQPDGSDVHIVSNSLVVSSDDPTREGGSIVSFSTLSGGRPGAVHVETQSLQLAAGGQIGSQSETDHTSGDVVVDAAGGTILVSGRGASGRPSGLFSRVDAAAAAAGEAPGMLQLTTRTLDLEDGALISTRTFGASDAGDATVVAEERISLRGSTRGASEISARGFDGNGGDVTLRAPLIELESAGLVAATTTGAGDAGSVTLTGLERLSISGSAEILGSTTRSGLYVETTRPQGGGDAGSIVVESSGAVTLSDGGTISVRTAGSGDGGEIRIEAGGRFAMGAGTSINSVSASSSPAAGRAGTILIEAGDAVVVHGGTIASSAMMAPGGDIAIRAGSARPLSVLLSGGAEVQARAFGAGDAGSVRIENAWDVLAVDSAITTEAKQSGGGAVSIHALDRVELVRSRIATDVESETGGGGDITIDPRFVVLNASRITASADQGPGGDIEISALQYFQSADSVLDAKSNNVGLDGEINIRAPENELANELAPLTDRYFDAAALLRAPCAARHAEDQSSFVVRGREGLPASAEGPLPLPLPVPGLDGPAREDPSGAAHASPDALAGVGAPMLRPDCRRWWSPAAGALD